MTLRREFGRFDGLRVAIVGDILHSRVARSNIVGMRALGIDVTLVGPADAAAARLRRRRACASSATSTRCCRRVDAVMMLRIQRERISAGLLPALDDYTQRYQLNRARLRSLRDEAVILHPGRTTAASS